MGRDCACGGSVGTRDHWCAALQSIHAARVEALLRLIAEVLLVELSGEDEPKHVIDVHALNDHPYPDGLEP